MELSYRPILTTDTLSSPATVMDPYIAVLSADIWTVAKDRDATIPAHDVERAYERTRSLVRHSGMTAQDIVNLTSKFFDFAHSYIFTRDTAAYTISFIHWNLCLGVVAQYATTRPDLLPLIRSLESFDICGMYMLTELDHGLDTRNIETQVTLQADGSFDLHTPHPGAAKAMPPNGLLSGIPRMAVVCARLKAHGKDRGIKMFLVSLNTKDAMCEGVSCRHLPQRLGSRAVDHAITTFNHVTLPSSALLGSITKSEDPRAEFFRQIWRITIGSFALSVPNITMLRMSAFIAAKYSKRRHVGSGDMGTSERAPIISFSTSYGPILNAFCLAEVLEAFARHVETILPNPAVKVTVRTGLAHTFKATVIYWAQPTARELAMRCGWHGLFGCNQIPELAAAMNGASIAEGDSLVLCIRLVIDLLTGRLRLPPPTDATTLLSRYEKGVWDEARRVFKTLAKSDHKGAEFNTHILPRCHSLVRAIGHRMAFEAAAKSGHIPVEILTLYESLCIMDDLSWYIENAGITRQQMAEANARATDAVLPLLDGLMESSGAAPWVTAPIADETAWMRFIEALPVSQGREMRHSRL